MREDFAEFKLDLFQTEIIDIRIPRKAGDSALAQEIYLIAHGDDVHDISARGKEVAPSRILFAIAFP